MIVRVQYCHHWFTNCNHLHISLNTHHCSKQISWLPKSKITITTSSSAIINVSLNSHHCSKQSWRLPQLSITITASSIAITTMSLHSHYFIKQSSWLPNKVVEYGPVWRLSTALCGTLSTCIFVDSTVEFCVLQWNHTQHLALTNYLHVLPNVVA